MDLQSRSHVSASPAHPCLAPDVDEFIRYVGLLLLINQILSRTQAVPLDVESIDQEATHGKVGKYCSISVFLCRSNIPFPEYHHRNVYAQRHFIRSPNAGTLFETNYRGKSRASNFSCTPSPRVRVRQPALCLLPAIQPSPLSQDATFPGQMLRA